MRAQIAICELVAARVGEHVFFPDCEPLPVENDYVEARALASIVCSPGAIDAFIHFAEVEAAAIIRPHCCAVKATADALMEQGTIDGNRVDEIIACAADIETLAIEHERRREMQGRAESASRLREFAVQSASRELFRRR